MQPLVCLWYRFFLTHLHLHLPAASLLADVDLWIQLCSMSSADPSTRGEHIGWYGIVLSHAGGSSRSHGVRTCMLDCYSCWREWLAHEEVTLLLHILPAKRS